MSPSLHKADSSRMKLSPYIGNRADDGNADGTKHLAMHNTGSLGALVSGHFSLSVSAVIVRCRERRICPSQQRELSGGIVVKELGQ